MSNNENDFGRRIQDLFSRAVKEQVRMAQNYTEFVQRVGRGDLFTEPARNELLSFAGQETANYARELTSLSLQYYSELFKLNRAYSDRFFEQVMGKPSDKEGGTETAAEAAQPADRPTVRRIEVTMQAPLGQTAVRAFTLENKQQETAEISFLVSDFVGPEEAASFRPDLNIEPARFTLPPGEAQTVTLKLPLTADRFTPGQPYRATVVVRGYDGLELELIGLAEPTPSKDADPPAAKKSTRGRKQTRGKPDAA
jgi:hypothetical protein